MQRPKPERGGFELEVSKQEETFAWSSKKVEQLMIAIEEGYKPSYYI